MHPVARAISVQQSQDQRILNVTHDTILIEQPGNVWKYFGINPDSLHVMQVLVIRTEAAREVVDEVHAVGIVVVAIL